MIGWLRRELTNPAVTIAGREIPLAIRRHPRATRLIMRLAPDGSEVRITMPKWGQTQDALLFAHKRTDWLERQLEAVSPPEPIETGGSLAYRGMILTIEWNPNLPRMPRAQGDRLWIGGPETSLAARIRRWLEAEAMCLFAHDIAHYCARAGRPVPDLRLSRAKRRWGSCSGARNGTHCVRLNWRLVQAPDDVRRSVVAHEVAHLVHFDHSPAFHALLGDLFEGDLRMADAWLKREGRSLYTRFG